MNPDPPLSLSDPKLVVALDEGAGNEYEARAFAFRAVIESHPSNIAWREFYQSQRAAEMQRAAQRIGLRHLDTWINGRSATPREPALWYGPERGWERLGA